MNKSLYITAALLVGALVAGASSVFAIGNFGKKLEIAVDQTGKPKNLSVVYAYDMNWGWYVQAGTTLKPEDIVDLPEKVTVRLVDESSGKVYYANENTNKRILLHTTVTIKDESVLRQFLPHQKNAVVVISNKNENLYYLSLADACSYSAHVSNLSKKGRPACVVEEKDFSNKTEICEDQKTKLLQFIGQGYLTCTAAKEIYSKMGCGELPCK